MVIVISYENFGDLLRELKNTMMKNNLFAVVGFLWILILLELFSIMSFAAQTNIIETTDYPGNEVKTIEKPFKIFPGGLTEFSDVKGHWAEKNVLQLLGSGVIAGYNDGTIRPNLPITRAEVVVLVSKAFAIEPISITTPIFEDEKSIKPWALGYVAAVSEKGIVSGRPGNLFSPNDYITRSEMVVILVKAKGIVVNAGVAEGDKGLVESGLTYNDKNSIPFWARTFFNKAFEKKILKGYPDNTIRPGNLVSRAEAFSMICNML